MSISDLHGTTTGLDIAHAAEAERTRLRAEAADLGGPSPLVSFRDSPESGIDISKAHPGSLPQFITGKSTLLSNLFRDEVGLRTARLAAERITAKNTELRTVRGIEAVHLAVGVARWRIGGAGFAAPVLLRPLAIRRHHSDFELKLQGTFEVNPELVRIARDHFGLTIDATALAALAYDGGIFKPQPVIDSLRAMTRSIDTFSVEPRLVVSTFADVSGLMSRDGGSLDHPVLNALAGHVGDRERVTAPRAIPHHIGPDDRAPASDNLLLDADAEQEAVLARIAAGHSLTVATLPGTGGTQTVINALGELVRGGKRVLVVSARRSTLDGVRHRLAGIGLDSLAISPASVRRDLVRAIGRNEKATAPKVSEVDDALVRLRTVLRDYRQALSAPVAGLDASVLDATRQLTRLASLPVPPSTTARLGPDALRRLAADRTEAAEALAQAARLGEFRFGPNDSPWYGVTFSSTEAARAAHELAGRLHANSVPAVLERGYELIAQTHMRPFSTIDELGEYLRLLQGIRDSLDRFSPTVFERPLGELIQAHGSRRDAPGLSGANRRRLRRLAKEYVRPGVHVTEMHEALLRIQAQRTQWQRCVEAGVAPEIPLGLADVYVAWQRVEAELAELDAALGRREPLASLPVARLVRTLAGLAAKSDVFENLVERAQLRDRLALLGLEPLLAELSVRHVSESQVGEELEFAWWQSLLERALQDNRALLGANTAVVDRLERDFRLVDEAHAAMAGPLLAWQLANQWRIAIVDEPQQSQHLRRALTQSATTTAQVVSAAPTLVDVLAPVWISSPYLVPEIPDSVEFDTVILVDAAAINLAEAAPAIRRARQIVAFGDPVTQRPTPFRIAVDPEESWEAEVPFDDVSAFERLSELLPVMTLTRSYRAGGEDLAELINDAFYGGEIVSLPWAGSYLGRGSLTVDYVEGGTGTPDPISGAVESPDAEVARVVTLVVEHAVHRPAESLMVVTASARHAERVRAAVTSAFAGRSDVADFVGRDTVEPFAVLTLEESVAESRDRVIFSLGFGLTKHGRVLSDFGDLSTPDGERLLTVGMTRARRSMVLVSSIRPSSFDDGRLEHGAATLMSILGGLAARSRDARLEDLADPLTLALARELRRLGASVDVDYRGLLPLVAQHGGKAVVIESDPETRGESLRETLRLRPHVLRRLGWHYVRVHAFDLYSDPVTAATRIAAVLGISESTPRAENDTQPIDIADTRDD
ncbi:MULTISPECIES: ATP-binding protein [unclassified Microbacterium]|uniref:ATP-binding protein n=1 Tax=unclassified Microbacterium TaxID=2609290 RepID=UPI0004933DBC|nr:MULTISPECIES: ATP-binding protein [unclassified Microbacterium]MCV0334466.1 ATP-binding protein [Microbacterium sp.]MCV0376349.1 ATP-binding protein [Microbacterium sp.]MCV0389908.1 ATP-binding protein [Microbacterium sp.]MCV0419443.1 ATP-binding protein [Microbacterium sp.]MCV0421748.1 ATP-binding protein [Microbacterium sp.]